MESHNIYQDGYNAWLDGNYENPYDSEFEEDEYLWWERGQTDAGMDS